MQEVRQVNALISCGHQICMVQCLKSQAYEVMHFFVPAHRTGEGSLKNIFVFGPMEQNQSLTYLTSAG